MELRRIRPLFLGIINFNFAYSGIGQYTFAIDKGGDN